MLPQPILETIEECCPKCGTPIKYRTQREYCRLSGRAASLKKMYETCPKVHDEYSAAHAVSALPCDKCQELTVYEDMGTLTSIETIIRFNCLKIIHTHKCSKCGTQFICVKHFKLPLMRF